MGVIFGSVSKGRMMRRRRRRRRKKKKKKKKKKECSGLRRMKQEVGQITQVLQHICSSPTIVSIMK
jgi:hypothetical protein